MKTKKSFIALATVEALKTFVKSERRGANPETEITAVKNDESC